MCVTQRTVVPSPLLLQRNPSLVILPENSTLYNQKDEFLGRSPLALQITKC